MHTRRTRLTLLSGSAVAALFASATTLLAGTHADAIVRLSIGLTALILAAVIVDTCVSGIQHHRMEQRFLMLELMSRARDQKLDQLERDLKCDRMYFRDVLQDLGRKMDAIAKVEKRRVALMRGDLDDSGPRPLPQL